MATPHNNAERGDIAKTILLPGDPLRAKYIAETYFEDAKQFTDVRGMYGYTGTYKGKELSVMGTGMGCASMGIYSYELIHMYGVENLIRIGSCGGFGEDLELGDLVIAMGACSDTNYANQYGLPGNYAAIASFDLLREAVAEAESRELDFVVGNVLCTDVFYRKEGATQPWEDMGVLAAEMESYALYCNAAAGGARALTLLTVGGLPNAKKQLSNEQRETGLNNMIEVALETAWEVTEE